MKTMKTAKKPVKKTVKKRTMKKKTMKTAKKPVKKTLGDEVYEHGFEAGMARCDSEEDFGGEEEEQAWAELQDYAIDGAQRYEEEFKEGFRDGWEEAALDLDDGEDDIDHRPSTP